ncbi:ImmA/IrrE family metallo-endopeptidase [Paraburkholderia guartelaensis]|uniref:ImmA/IrrE family metallo-endopeptidase n=1 Tax=Paraburkholderia guartelaensis TaxID=2546446 RepID=A0A4R5L981_9BURK|nr:ImmA/IrrE family metallo-endopeptidase [Paraburkholderia guartelaensis]TDG05087.1 ImmA/IrrE family metallo-endopeptidase [Paraburkholderia guartelaensis]
MSPSPAKEANRLSQILDTFHQIHGGARFPVNVDALALDCASLFKMPDPVVRVQAADIQGFEGGLFKTGSAEWSILYNESLTSPGRIRFTKAHELGHYVLHRAGQDTFECSAKDMLEWTRAEKAIESDADKFASYLLMPLHDFRAQVTGEVTLHALGACAERYGVSLTAAILQWLSYTDEKAVLVMSRDGFMDWSSASEPAFKAGAYFATRKSTIEIPASSLASNGQIAHEKEGIFLPASVWFPHADPTMQLREMKISAEQYDCTLTLLALPKGAEVWPPRETSGPSEP